MTQGRSLYFELDIQPDTNNMYKTALLALVGFSSAAPTDETCSWVGGAYGQPIQCPDGYMTQGICGSGQTADCNGYHTEMYCCATSASSNCAWHGGADGDLISCSSGQSVRGICGSGIRADCRTSSTKQFYSQLCCDTSDYSIDPSALSYMQYSDFGVRMECQDGEAMLAGCGSGAIPACTGVNTDHGFTLEEIIEIKKQVGKGNFNALKCQAVVYN